MLLSILYPYARFTLGTLYPAYKTWKALKRKDETTRRRWMKYWVSFSAFQAFELIADFTIAYLIPFYIELKLLAILWLVHGTKFIFDTIVNRELTKREKSIDRWLTKIYKVRDEITALVWFEASRFLVRILTSLMSCGFSVLTTDESSPMEQQGSNNAREQGDLAGEQEEDGDDSNMTVHYELETDVNENTVSTMEWSAITLNGAPRKSSRNKVLSVRAE